jgi:hypothetical protein
VFARMVVGASQKGLDRQAAEIRQGYEAIRERQRLCRSIGSLVELMLLCSGFVRYRRGPWRRRRVMRELPGPSNDVGADQRLGLAIRRMAQAVVDGDTGALVLLQRISRLNPVAVADEIGQTFQDLAHDAIATSAARGDSKRYTNMRAQLKLEADNLAGDNPSPVMAACASWVAILQAHASIESAKISRSQASGGLLDRVSKAYLHAAKTLVQIEALETRRPRRPRVRAAKVRAVNATFKVIQ